MLLTVLRFSGAQPPNSNFTSLRIYGGIEMKLRRLEFVVIGVTLAFACFIGGFFSGRSWSAVNVISVAAQSEDTYSTEVVLQGVPDNHATGDSNTDIIATPAVTEPVQHDSTQPVSTPEATGAPRSGDGRININLASQSELTDLPGIGNVLASRIVDYRRQHGDFVRIEDIRNVSGIGEKRYEAIQDKITVG